MMDESEQLQLIPVIYRDGPLGQKIPEELPPVLVFCTEQSPSRTEWETAARSGLKSEYKLKMCASEYAGEEIVVYKGQRFKIYRTYEVPGTEDLELYLGRKLGI